MDGEEKAPSPPDDGGVKAVDGKLKIKGMSGLMADFHSFGVLLFLV
jgi:hypothetical protein